MRACDGRAPVLVDWGSWDRWALDSLGLPRRPGSSGERGGVERWIGIFKGRANQFGKRWPHNAGPLVVYSWCGAFVALDNLEGS